MLFNKNRMQAFTNKLLKLLLSVIPLRSITVKGTTPVCQLHRKPFYSVIKWMKECKLVASGYIHRYKHNTLKSMHNCLQLSCIVGNEGTRFLKWKRTSLVLFHQHPWWVWQCSSSASPPFKEWCTIYHVECIHLGAPISSDGRAGDPCRETLS